MDNNLMALNNYLFETLERLTDDELTDEQLNREIDRSKAVSHVAEKIIKGGELALKAAVTAEEFGLSNKKEIPKMLEAK